jgi:CubicO group peptidase (beta-lactamase class C family)
MKNVTLLITIVMIFISITLKAKDVPVENLTQKVDSLISLQHNPDEPGGVAAVLSRDGVLYKNTFGLMNVERTLENNENTLFDIASVAKQFTAFAILMLEDEGKLNLDDDIRNHLPDLPAYEHKVTILHLLQHTSGIASTDVLRLLAGLSFDERWTQRDEIALIKQYPYLNFEPNTTHLYSNAGYSLLAGIIENVSGFSYPEFMNSKIFKPLGMTSSFVMYTELDDFSDFALGYKKENDDFIVFSDFSDLSYGGHNIFTTLDDMILWGQNILSPTIGTIDFYRKISQPFNTMANGDTLFYTYGFYVRNHKGMRMVEHSGGVPGFRNQFMIFPEDDSIIFMMCNNESINTRRLATGIADIIFGDKLVEETPAPRIAIDFGMDDVKAFEGSYRMPDGMELRFVAEQDTFWLVLPDDARFQLFAENETGFFLKAFDAQCTFVQSDDGTVNEMIWHQRGQDYTAGRVEEIISLTPDEFAPYAGTYYHPELKVEYPVVFEDNELKLYTPATFKKYLGFDLAVLSHINGDKFYADWLGTLEFTRDEDNRIDGFVLLNVGRLQNVRFSIQPL